MIVRIDVRETDLIHKVRALIENIPSFRDLKLQIEKLDIGDIIIASDQEEKWIIERKSVNDLVASIKDGRYEEQSYRLDGLATPNHNIIYLIEGNVDRLTSSNNAFHDRGLMAASQKTMVYSAMVSLNYYKGFSVMRTFSLDETALFVCNAAKKIEKGDLEKRKAFYEGNKEQIVGGGEGQQEKEKEKEKEKEEEKHPNDYVHVVKKVKKENITPENIDAIMLQQIPGISSSMAIEILLQTGTLENLIRSMRENATFLQTFQYKNEKEQVKKLNKTIVANLQRFLVK